jgi:hypothetical protein
VCGWLGQLERDALYRRRNGIERLVGTLKPFPPRRDPLRRTRRPRSRLRPDRLDDFRLRRFGETAQIGRSPEAAAWSAHPTASSAAPIPRPHGNVSWPPLRFAAAVR